MPVQEVNRLLKQFMQMERVMKKMKGGGLARMMRGLSGSFQAGAARARAAGPTWPLSLSFTE